MKYNLQPAYEIGDLVIFNKRGKRVWRIDGYSHEAVLKKGKIDSTITYALSCVVSTEYDFAEEESVILVCKKAYSDTYIKLVDKDGMAPLYTPIKLFSPPSVAKIGVPEAKERSTNSYEEVDRLLLELAKMLAVKEKLGEVSIEFQASIDRLLERVASVSEEDSNSID